MRRSAAGIAIAIAVALSGGAGLTGAANVAGQQRAETGRLPSGGLDQQRKFIDRQGLVLRTELVYLIYWGGAWTRPDAQTPTAEQVTSATHTMLASSYMAGLAEYQGIGRGELRGSKVLSSSEPPNDFSDDDVRQLVRDQISADTIPGPDASNQTLYGVVMPPGVKPEYAAWEGAHNSDGGDGHGIHYAWFANSDSLNGLTRIMSHEIVEAATDPEGEGFLGSRGTCSQEGWCEIADICTATGVVDGVTVQSYWSDKAGECVVPTGSVPAESHLAARGTEVKSADERLQLHRRTVPGSALP
jgi:hypothetical protein